MCKNAAPTVSSVMKAMRPTLISVLTLVGQADTPNGLAAVAAFDAAQVAAQNWKQGTNADNILQLLGDFQVAFNAVVEPLDLPPQTVALVNVILAGVETVLGIIIANSPAPPAPAGITSLKEPQALHQATVASDTVVKVHALVPGIKLSRFHSPASQYNHAWNKAVDAGGFDPSLKAA